jgi:orotidine-5'-phosphate decarboxylase
MYAESFFGEMNVDSVTVAPYMGQDSVTPFLGHEGRWVILLALTSNKGADDFQYIQDPDGTPLYQNVLRKSLEWGGNADNMMYVVGATRAEMLTDIRKTVPDSFLLVPGIGAQGGSLADVCKYGMNSKCGLIVNSSRAIIYADGTEKFAQVAGQKAKEVQQEMAAYIK